MQYYSQINPAAKNDQIDDYECEPYVYAQNILGDEHPQFGLARNSWLSGTASWMYQAGTQYILGIQPTYQGLRIDPCIPKDWDQFTVTRRFRGVIYSIAVQNPGHVNQRRAVGARGWGTHQGECRAHLCRWDAFSRGDSGIKIRIPFASNSTIGRVSPTRPVFSLRMNRRDAEGAEVYQRKS